MSLRDVGRLVHSFRSTQIFVIQGIKSSCTHWDECGEIGMSRCWTWPVGVENCGWFPAGFQVFAVSGRMMELVQLMNSSDNLQTVIMLNSCCSDDVGCST